MPDIQSRQSEVPDTHDTPLQWYVLTSLSPKYAEEKLLSANEERSSSAKGQHVFQYFIPYLFLKRRIDHESTSDLPDSFSDTTPRSKSQTRANNEARSALRRFVFVRAREAELTEFLSGDWNLWGRNKLQYYLDRQRQKVTATDRMMAMFIEACSDMQLQFEIGSPVDGLAAGEEVVLGSTPFRGEKANVLEVNHTENGLRLTLGLTLFSGTMTLRLNNITEQDIIRTRGNAILVDDSHLIDNTQRLLLSILSRRINGKQTEETRRQDSETLDRLFNYRYHVIPTPSARRHFLALQLICAHLRHDTVSQEELIALAISELDAINNRTKTKAATDVRAYLHSALYLSTGNPVYRDAAKQYVREHNPKSNALRRLVKLIRTKRV